MATYSSTALVRTIRNFKAAARQDRVLGVPFGTGLAEDAERAFLHAQGVITPKILKKQAMVALGKLMAPNEKPGYIAAVIRIRQAIVSGNLDDQDHIILFAEAHERLKTTAETFPDADKKRAQDLLPVLEALGQAGLTEINYFHLWQHKASARSP